MILVGGIQVRKTCAEAQKQMSTEEAEQQPEW